MSTEERTKRCFKNEQMHFNSISNFIFTGNAMAIAVLFRRDMDLKPTFMQILVTMMTFDFLCIFFNLLVFCLPVLSNEYKDGVAPYIIPYILPMAQIALTGNFFLLDIIFNGNFFLHIQRGTEYRYIRKKNQQSTKRCNIKN